ncbi:MAG: cell wall hydrolase [Clostridia bacterium]|nr:cell wall hydrolase [Clostridia bacterium]
MWKNRYKSVLAAVLSAMLLSLPAQASSYSEQTLQLTARAVAAECPDASFGVQIALAAVIFNRMETPGFGDTAAQVIWASDFLTCTATGRIVLPAEEKTFAQALAAVRYAAEGMDPTGGAVWYGGGDTGRTSGSVWYGDGGYLFWGD